jgi:hypothetical protein
VLKLMMPPKLQMIATAKRTHGTQETHVARARKTRSKRARIPAVALAIPAMPSSFAIPAPGLTNSLLRNVLLEISAGWSTIFASI